MRVAVSGFKHGHICTVIDQVKANPELEIVAATEEYPQKYKDYIDATGVQITHADWRKMIDDVDFDVLIIGDAYAQRGAQVIRALEAGKHILTDKPLCCSLEELEQIRRLGQSKRRSVIVGLENRYRPCWQTAKRLIASNEIGQLSSIAVFGHHPLNYKTGRPDWYFEPGMHGGIFNDLLIHAVDGLEWMTNLQISEIIAARAWNSELPQVPFFQDAGQVMLKLEKDVGVIADCSYKTPEGHSSPWTFYFWGTEGMLKLTTKDKIIIQRHMEPEKEIVPTLQNKTTLINDLLADINSDSAYSAILTTEECLASTYKTLLVQEAADKDRTKVPIIPLKKSLTT